MCYFDSMTLSIILTKKYQDNTLIKFGSKTTKFVIFHILYWQRKIKKLPSFFKCFFNKNRSFFIWPESDLLQLNFSTGSWKLWMNLNGGNFEFHNSKYSITIFIFLNIWLKYNFHRENMLFYDKNTAYYTAFQKPLPEIGLETLHDIGLSPLLNPY